MCTYSVYVRHPLIHKKSAEHGNADALSRLPLPKGISSTSIPVESVLLLKQMNEMPVTAEHIKTWTWWILFSLKYSSSLSTDGLLDCKLQKNLDLTGRSGWTFITIRGSFVGRESYCSGGWSIKGMAGAA